MRFNISWRYVMGPVVFALGAWPVMAFAVNARTTNRCEFLFEAPPLERVPFLERPRHQTAEIVGLETYERGEEFFRLRRLDPSMPWGSRFATRSFDPQGDPSLIFYTMGPDLSRILGFRYDGDDLIAPTAETMNRRIARFNRYLLSKNIEPIPVSFYSQAIALKETFLRHWFQALRIPVAADLSTHTIHDISFHYSAVLMPPQMAHMLQAQAGIAWRWMQRPEAQLLPKLTSEAVRRIDHISVSANVVPGERGLSHFRFWENVFADVGTDELRARFKTPIELFRERMMMSNLAGEDSSASPLVENLRLKTDPFYAELKTAFPEWNRKVEDFGLSNYASVRELYFARSADLRYAAREFLKESAR